MASATSTLATIMTSVLATVVELITTVITEYWPYILVFTVLAALVGFFGRKILAVVRGSGK